MSKQKITFRKWDAADYLATEKDIAEYLDVVMEEGDENDLKAAMADIARARGMTETARHSGLSRPGLYRAFSAGGNPELQTFNNVLKTFGCRLSVKPL